MEIKYAINGDIRDVDQQLSRYYYAIKPIAEQVAKDHEEIFRQKLELGLYLQSQDRLDAMKTLVFSRDFSSFQFILVLVDYNPYSSKFNIEKN